MLAEAVVVALALFMSTSLAAAVGVTLGATYGSRTIRVGPPHEVFVAKSVAKETGGRMELPA